MKLNENRGITLIALVITIVVLLILASVSIVILIGKNGIMSQINKAKIEYESATELEKIQLAVTQAYIDNPGNLKEENLKNALEDFEFAVEENLINKNTNWLFKISGKTYRIDTYGNVKLIFDENTFRIGLPQNIDNYGKLVNFESENGINNWRLFYQDDNYSYLIYDGIYDDPVTDYSSYKDGSYVGSIGKKLSPKINNLFLPNNANSNIRKTASLLDTKFWGNTEKFEDINGIALFAIGSPTIELFTSSYNAASKVANINKYFINIESDNTGYKLFDTSNGYFQPNDKNGIYNLGKDGQWWLASPCNSKYHNFRIIPNMGYWALGDVTGGIYPGVRPIICINNSDLIMKSST